MIMLFGSAVGHIIVHVSFVVFAPFERLKRREARRLGQIGYKVLSVVSSINAEKSNGTLADIEERSIGR